MKITYDYVQPTQDPDVPQGMTQHSGKNVMFAFNIGEVRFTVEPQNVTGRFLFVPAKLLRDGAIAGSNVVVIDATTVGAHQDYQFMKDSTEFTYTIRTVVGGAVVEKEMPAGAHAGQEGRMTLYKGVTTVADMALGKWTERLIRPFIINAADLAARDTGWPLTGAPPTVSTTRQIVDNLGDGYNHV